MEAPPNIKDKLRRNETFQKNSEKNESYTLNIKLENNDSIYTSITLQEDNKSFEDINCMRKSKGSKHILKIIVLKKYMMKFLI